MFFSEIYESWREIQYEKYEEILERIEKNDLSLGKLVLDLGSASGFLFDFLAERDVESEVVALDIDVASLEKNPSDHLIIGDGNNLPFKSCVFDSLFCVDVAHLLDNLRFDCVKKNGTIILALPARHKEIFESLVAESDHCQLIEKFEVNGREKELVALLKKL